MSLLDRHMHTHVALGGIPVPTSPLHARLHNLRQSLYMLPPLYGRLYTLDYTEQLATTPYQTPHKQTHRAVGYHTVSNATQANT